MVLTNQFGALFLFDYFPHFLYRMPIKSSECFLFYPYL